MFKEGWVRQRQRVRRLNRHVSTWASQEAQLRQSWKSATVNLLTRFETLVVIGATGAVWASHLKKDKDDARERPVLALLGAAFVVRKWRIIAGDLADKFGLNRRARSNRFAPVNQDARQPDAARNRLAENIGGRNQRSGS